ncbi:MAG: hypothetical protein JXJ22_05585 [Bacteroidales bacterium]|nr:hypothetical protein [Bacteroidales bacterium]
MKNVLAYLGIIVVIIGVVILMFSVITDSIRNTMLLTSAILIIAGFILHIIFNKEVI